MSRRGRAIAFLTLALVAAALSAALVRGYGSRVAHGYGPLRPVVIIGGEMKPGKPIGPEQAAASMEVRRVPARFIPPDALATPEEAVGLVLRVPMPPGSYLLGSALGPPSRRHDRGSRLRAGRRPVEISVSGADPLLAAGPQPAGAKVDIVVTTEPGGPGPGRTYVAAAGVPLLALRAGPDGPGPEGLSAATLGLTRPQALRLIEAESFARKLTLLPTG